MYKSLAFAAIFLCLQGCATLSTISTSHDEFQGTDMLELNYNPLAGYSLLDTRQVRFQVTRSEGKTDAVYYIKIVIIGNSDGWTFIEKGDSLVLLVDGERFALNGTGSSGRRVVTSDANTREMSIYPTNRDFLGILASANEVKVRVVGSRANVDRHFGTANFRNLRDFLDRSDALLRESVTTDQIVQ